MSAVTTAFLCGFGSCMLMVAIAIGLTAAFGKPGWDDEPDGEGPDAI